MCFKRKFYISSFFFNLKMDYSDKERGYLRYSSGGRCRMSEEWYQGLMEWMDEIQKDIMKINKERETERETESIDSHLE
jgi:hypothetical protein